MNCKINGNLFSESYLLNFPLFSVSPSTLFLELYGSVFWIISIIRNKLSSLELVELPVVSILFTFFSLYQISVFFNYFSSIELSFQVHHG